MKFFFKDIPTPNGFFKLTLILFLLNSSAKAQIKTIFINDENGLSSAKKLLLKSLNTIKLNITTKNLYDSTKVSKLRGILYDPANNPIDTATSIDDVLHFERTITGVNDNGKPQIPRGFSLEQNYPNEFSSSTNIEFQIAKKGSISLKVYDILGHELADIVSGDLEAGQWRAIFNADKLGIASQPLIYMLSTPEGTVQKKMMYVKNSNTAGPSGNSLVSLGPVDEIKLQKSGNANSAATAIYRVEISPTDSTSPVMVKPGIFLLPFDNDTSYVIYVEPTERLLSFSLTDYFLGKGVDSVYIRTSKEKGNTSQKQKFRASFNEEHVIVNGPRHLRSGIIVPAGTANLNLAHYLCNADTARQGLDTVYFDKLLKMSGAPWNGYRTTPYPPNGAYVALASEQLKDTIYVYGITPLTSLSYRGVESLNAIAEFFNTTLKEMTTTKRHPNGMFGIGRNIIAIADSNFNKPDSIAKFQYPNMVVVPNARAPIDYNTFINYIRVEAMNGAGGNATDIMPDNVTVRGGVIMTSRSVPRETIKWLMEEEGLAMILGDVESAIVYPSLYDKFQGIIFPQDKRRQEWITFRGAGHRYPDLPNGFKPK